MHAPLHAACQARVGHRIRKSKEGMDQALMALRARSITDCRRVGQLYSSR